VTNLFASLEASAFSTWLRESGSIWAYPLVLTLHTVGLALLVGANAVLDLRVLGFGRGIPLAELKSSFRVMWIGFWVNAISGVMLFAADATTKGSTQLFLWKLVLIAVAVVVIFQTKRQVYARRTETQEVTPLARALAVTSLVLWIAAIAAGRFMAYV
jgi:hypothetical protein